MNYTSLQQYHSLYSYQLQENYSDIPFRILLKFPSRSRPDKLKSTFTRYISMAKQPHLLYALISLDEDDKTATPQLIQELKTIHPFTDVIIGKSVGKIGAVNRDMEHANSKSFDIILLASDDMIPEVQGYDDIIRNHFKQYYPDRDGVLWYNDGFQGSKLNTLCILGKTYYDRFHYIYHPSYKSLYCDNEFTEVAKRLGKQTYFDQVIIRHEHPVTNQSVIRDALYDQNQIYVMRDYNQFLKRRSEGFP